MKINFIDFNKNRIAEIISDIIEVGNIQNAIDIMADCRNQGANKIILYEKNICLDFFDLKTGIAGDILQKFSNYRVQIAIVGDFSKYTSRSLKDFIYESNKHGRISFVSSFDEAKMKLK